MFVGNKSQRSNSWVNNHYAMLAPSFTPFKLKAMTSLASIDWWPHGKHESLESPRTLKYYKCEFVSSWRMDVSCVVVSQQKAIQGVQCHNMPTRHLSSELDLIPRPKQEHLNSQGQSPQRWRWGCQLYAPAALYSHETFFLLLVLISARCWVNSKA
jgi:hypothetical protein